MVPASAGAWPAARSLLNLSGIAPIVPIRDARGEVASGGVSPAMKHRSSQTLFDHWRDRRAGRPLPERSEIDPGSIRTALGDTFILTFNVLTHHPFRLAGTRVCALFGRELKGFGFGDLWAAADREQARALVRAAADDSAAVIAGATGRTIEGLSVDLEMLLLPLRHCGQTHLRMIGALAPLVPPFWLGTSPVVTLQLGEHRFLGHIEGAAAPPLAPVPPQPAVRQRHGLTVYDGGQS